MEELVMKELPEAAKKAVRMVAWSSGGLVIQITRAVAEELVRSGKRLDELLARNGSNPVLAKKRGGEQLLHFRRRRIEIFGVFFPEPTDAKIQGIVKTFFIA